MGLLNRRRKESDAKVEDARRQIDLAVLKMQEIFEKVDTQVSQAKEELSERRAG